MIHNPVARVVAALAGAGAVLVLLSSCFLLPTGSTGITPTGSSTQSAPHDASQPAVGDCWRGSYANLAEWSTWQGDDPVACDRRHQSYTFAVGQLDEPLDQPWADGAITSELGAAVSNACGPAFSTLGFPDSAIRVNLYFFVSDEKAWTAGDHGYRCDVAVYAIGSDYYNPDLMNLPDDFASLQADAADNPQVYELCLTGDGFGPYESSALTYADCTGDHIWRYGERIDYPSHPADALPSTDELFAFADAKCGELDARQGEDVFPYVPTLEMWNTGNRFVECWFSLLQTPTSIV